MNNKNDYLIYALLLELSCMVKERMANNKKAYINSTTNPDYWFGKLTEAEEIEKEIFRVVIEFEEKINNDNKGKQKTK